MDIVKLVSTLSTLDDETKRLILNEYNWGQGVPMIYPNNDYGLDEVCQEISISDALANSADYYSPKDKFVFLNECNQLISFSHICPLWKDIASWMIEAKEAEAECAWDMLNEATM